MDIASVLSILVNIISFHKMRTHISPEKLLNVISKLTTKVNCSLLLTINVQSGRLLHNSPHPQCKSTPNLNDYSKKMSLIH